MKINKKNLIKLSLYMIAAGFILTVIGLLFGGRPGVTFSRNGVTSPYTQSHPYSMEKTKIDAFSNLKLNIDSYADIRILPSEDEQFYLEYALDGNYKKPDFSVAQDTLTLTHNSSTGQGIYFFNMNWFGEDTEEIHAYVTLYIPAEREMKKLSVYNDCGDISIEGLTFGDAVLHASYGNMNLTDLEFQDLETVLDSGDLKADSMNSKTLTLNSEYGAVALKDVSFGQADLNLDSGDLKAENFTADTLTVKNEYGDVQLQETSFETADFTLDSGDLRIDAISLGSLSCKNEYGNVTIHLPEDLAEYSIDARCEYGTIQLPPDAPQSYYIASGDEAEYKTQGSTKHRITLETESGDIIIKN